MMPPASHSGRTSRASFRISASFMESIFDVTYDLVDDPDCCEWQFLSPGFPVWEELNTVGVATGTRVACGS
jgi:hypothetical protein